MTRKEAYDYKAKMQALAEVRTARVVRILPDDVDPIVDGDAGWDVLIVTEDNS